MKPDSEAEAGVKITRVGRSSGDCAIMRGGAAAPARQHLAQLSQALPACLCAGFAVAAKCDDFDECDACAEWDACAACTECAAVVGDASVRLFSVAALAE